MVIFYRPEDGLDDQASLGRFRKRPSDAQGTRASVGCLHSVHRTLLLRNQPSDVQVF
jgi:hypothetical protein